MSTILRSLKLMIGADFTQAQAGFNQAAKNFKAIGKDLTATGAALTKGLTVPILGAVAGIGTLAIKSGQAADELLTLSAKTGLSTDALQEMDYASRFIDVDLETMTDSMIKLTRSMDAARDGTEDQKEAFEKLGISITDSNGNLRNAKDVWAEAIDALQAIDNEAERDAISLRLFGRSAAELNPLIKAGSAELKRLGEEAHTAGAVMSGDSVRALGKFDDAMQKIQASFKTAGGEIAAAFVPVLNKLTPVITDTIAPAFKKLADIIVSLIDGFDKLNPGAKAAIGIFAGYSVAIGPALTAFGSLSTTIGNVSKALSVAAKGGGSFGSVLSSMIGPSGIFILATAALAGLAAGIMAITADSRAATAEVKKLTGTLEESSKAFDNQIKQTDVEASAASRLSDELYNLAGQERLTNAEKSRMTALVEQLNMLMPSLNLQIDAQTGKLNLQKDAVTRLIDEKRREIQLEAYRDRLLELYKESARLSDEMTAAQERLTAAKAKYNDVKWVSFIWDEINEGAELAEATKAVNLLTEEVTKNQNRVLAAEGSYDNLAESILNAGSAAKNASRDFGQKFTLEPSAPWQSGGYKMEAYASGTAYVPVTGPAILHQGEAVVPAAMNPFSGGSVGKGTYNINLYGQADPNAAANLVVSKLRMAGVVV
jgi:hypothetical protein